MSCELHLPGKADLRTHWLERSSHSRSGSPPGSSDPSVTKVTKTFRVQRGFSHSTDGRGVSLVEVERVVKEKKNIIKTSCRYAV